MSNAVQLSPLSPRAERTKASLVAAAREVIARDGFAAARITDIASEAGAAVGSFYTYFESKDAIFRDVVTAVADDFLVPREPGRDVLARIRDGNRTYVRLWAKNARILSVWQHRTLEDPFLFEIRQRNLNAFHQRAERLIRQLQQEGRVGKDVRPRFTAMALSGMVFSFCYETFLVESKGEFDEDEIADGLTELWSRALGIRAVKRGQSK